MPHIRIPPSPLICLGEGDHETTAIHKPNCRNCFYWRSLAPYPSYDQRRMLSSVRAIAASVASFQSPTSSARRFSFDHSGSRTRSSATVRSPAYR
jgi:hypothetical protein